MSRLRKYEKKLSLEEEILLSNGMNIPELKRLSSAWGSRGCKRQEYHSRLCKELTLISGQKPIVTRATKSVANFKLREGQAVGLKVTIRGKRMYNSRPFSNIVCPRIHDFRGFNKKGDGRGSYSLDCLINRCFRA